MNEIRPVHPSELDVLQSIDDDASSLFAEHGVVIDLPGDHVFVRAEVGRWLRSAEQGRAFVVSDQGGVALGFACLGWLDGEPYLEQLAVRAHAMRRGLGARLLQHSADWARANGGSALWLTTYRHLPFNGPYYERHGYAVIAESMCGLAIREVLTEQRRYLPAPEQRVAMRRSV